jgi:uncharacterized membrane protein SpoIIM required for sporulation
MVATAERPTLDLPSTAFRREREATWKELDRLLTIVEERGIRSLSPRQVADLPHLYRTTLSSLSLARSISLDKNLIEYLESLATRGYFNVYAPPRRLGAVVRKFFASDFPNAVRAFRWHVALAAGILMIGMAVGWMMFLNDPETYYSFVPEGLAEGRDPATPPERLRQTLFGGDGGGAFATFLFTHNARIGVLCFALGFAAGVPVFLLMLQNGVILGSMGALFASRGLGVEFFGWVLPHGVTELLAIVFCGAGGLVIAHKLILPGRRRRLDNLAEAGRQAGILATGAVAMHHVASLIEGIFRQAVHATALRYAVAIFSAAFWITYFSGAGRGRSAA